MRVTTPLPNLGLTPAEIDDIRRLATAARAGDAAARNALFTALARPIGQAVAARRYLWYGLERDEVTNETFLALADLLDSWVGNDIAEHFQAMYGRQLWRRLTRLHWSDRYALPLEVWAEVSDPETDLAHATVDLMTGLSPAARWLLIHQIRGLTPEDLAPHLGVSRRTVERRRLALAVALAADQPGGLLTPRRRLWYSPTQRIV